jgi:hypothetical protein
VSRGGVHRQRLEQATLSPGAPDGVATPRNIKRGIIKKQTGELVLPADVALCRVFFEPGMIDQEKDSEFTQLDATPTGVKWTIHGDVHNRFLLSVVKASERDHLVEAGVCRQPNDTKILKVGGSDIACQQGDYARFGFGSKC